MPRARKTTDSNSTPSKRRRTKPRTFHFKKHQPGGSVPYPDEEAPAFNLESVSLYLSQGWDPNTSWTEDELVFPPPGSGCVMPTPSDPWSHFNTPLHRALWQQQFDVAQLLLDHGADIELLNASGRTVLHEAIDQGFNALNRECSETAKWIVEHGANLDKKTEERTVVVAKDSHDGKSHQYHRSGGISALRMAITLRDLAKVKHLTETGANVNLPLDEEGCWSPLDVAFLRRQLDMVEILEQAGASFSTALDNNSGDDREESRKLLSFCMSGEGFIFHSAEYINSIPPSSCQAVFRSIVNTDEFRTAWEQGPSRDQASVSALFRLLSEKAQMRNPLEIPKSYCGLCTHVITKLNSSKSSDLQHASNLQELERTAGDGCPFCGLLLDAVDKSTVPESSGKQNIASSEGDKGETSSGTDYEDIPITLRVMGTFDGGRLQVRHGDKVSNLQISPLEEEFLDYSPHRSVEQAGGTGCSRALSLSKVWLRQCRESHPDCRRSHDSTDPVLPTRVLDVTGGTLEEPEIKLIETGRAKRGTYCALSYCWGKSRCVITTKANLADHKQDIPLSTLPKTIRDAVLATRGLGIDYLWVDSLCIVQDDKQDWAAEAARMGDVYTNAILTISTLTGTDCNDGLFTPHPLRQQYALPFPIPPTSRPDSDAIWFVPAVHPPVEENRYGVLQLPLRGPIHSRGWTFQEQMLSTRILWFGDGHVQWECLSKFAADSSPESMGHYQYPGNNSDEPYRSRRMKEHLQRPFKIKATLKPHDHETGGEKEDPIDAYTEWETLVAEYTTRNLTKETDRIPAILGLANVMGPMFGCKFFMGIWKGKHFLRSLLWQVYRGSYTAKNSYPSWTWASRSGCAIDYSMANLEGGRPSSWPTSLVAIDETHGSITLEGPVGKLTPEKMERHASRFGFGLIDKMSMDDDPKQSRDKPLSTYLDHLSGKSTSMPTLNDPKESLLQGREVWYIDIVKYEHGAEQQGYGYPMWPEGQPASVVRLLLEATDSQEPPRLFKRIGVAHVQLEELEGVLRDVVII